jgi:type IV secretory pathway VirJ component
MRLPLGDLANLAHFIQAYVKLPRYQPAILVGLGAGAELAAAALAQSLPGTFAGALTFDGCGSLGLRVPLCSRDGHASTSAAPAAPPGSACHGSHLRVALERRPKVPGGDAP